jgi:Rha family phage regulatory protein
MQPLSTVIPEVTIHNNRPVTTSIAVAGFFGKQHKDVLRKIDTLDSSPSFNRRNFAPVEYTDTKGEKRPAYEMTRNGFIFLVMGFTGKKAAAFKEAYIAEFDRMEAQLYQRAAKASKDALIPLRNALDVLIKSKGITLYNAHTLIQQRFNVASITDLKNEEVPEAIEYCHRVVLSGELLPRTEVIVATPQHDAELLALAEDAFSLIKEMDFAFELLGAAATRAEGRLFWSLMAMRKHVTTIAHGMVRKAGFPN